MRALMWFRADLRVRDNAALSAACRDAREVIAVFTICPVQWRSHDWGPVRVDFLLRNLRALRDALARLHIPLRIVTRPAFDDVPLALADLARGLRCDAIYLNDEYELNERRRDDALEALCKPLSIAVRRFTDQVILAPGSVLTSADAWYTVFTPFSRKWKQVLADRGGAPVLAAPRPRTPAGLASDPIPASLDGFVPTRSREDLWPAGEDHALDRLRAFRAQRIHAYHERRDSPAMNGTSTLSPYLALGVLSPRQCLHAALDADPDALNPARKARTGPSIWINELIWREFYRHLLVAFPRLCMHRPFKPETDRVPWRDDPANLDAWCRGRTGYPIIDAAMRQLIQTGWMHNRCRMIVAMFLTKNLLIDWRVGERFFMRHLIDGDLASNNGGWQWSASTGTDAAPYFRIYNPCSQSARHDPDATYIKRFCPELAPFPPSEIHDPLTMSDLARLAAGYPAPIIDHSSTRARAIEAFRNLSPNAP